MDDRLRRLLLGVQRPARYLGGEPGQVLKDPAAVRVRFCLCFPDAYEIGMSHLGLRILYSKLNRDERIWCERAFAPMPDMEQALRGAGLPLCTLESRTPLGRLDVLGFSLQHELSFTNVLLMLELGGVALRAEDRPLEAPLVLAGGPTAAHPEPLAPFLDAVALGDGEELAAEVALGWVEARRGCRDRGEALAELARHPAVYVPSLHEARLEPLSRRLVVGADAAGPALARARKVADLDEHPFPPDGPVALTEAVFDRAAVEIARGCSGGCRFCQAGMVYRPARERSLGAVLECVHGQLAEGGYDEASLASLSTADYSQVEALVRTAAAELGSKDVALSVSSLRAHGLDEGLAAALEAVRTSSLTLAPEAATQRLRDVINKNVTEEDIFRGANAAISRSRRRLKLYFMIGLPTETEEDVRAIADLALRLRRSLESRRGGKVGLTLTVSTFVPKPHTPLQWCGALGPEEIAERQAILRGLLARTGVELRPHDARLSVLEALLARADRSAATAVEAAYRAGARFDGWDDLFSAPAWDSAVAAWCADPAVQLAAIPLEARLPWDHLEVGPDRAYLGREHRRALAARPTAPCLRPDGQGGLACNHCGLDCDLDRQAAQLERARRSAASLRPAPAPRSEPGQGQRYRLVFEKAGDLAMLGHLDFVRLLTRLLRRAGAVLDYSRGFHPKPKLSVAAPLPLGLAGLAEVGDLSLVGPVEPDELLGTLARLAPAGLRPLVLRRLEPAEVGAARALAGAELLVASPALPADPTSAAAEVLGRQSLTSDRGRGGLVELRPQLVDLASCSDGALLERLGASGPAIVCRVALGRGPSIRPSELLGWLGAEDRAPDAFRLSLLREPLPTPLR